MRTWGLVLCLLALPALALGQSLAEAARKERERREKLRKSGTAARTVTEEELASAKGQLANEPEKAPPATDAKAAETSGESGQPRKATPQPSEEQVRKAQEAQWRGRAAEARRRIDLAEARHLELQSQILFGQPEMMDESGRVTIHSPQQMKEMADQAEAEVAEAKKALDDLLEEARRARVPPGWLR
jgi:hypothetical protein